MNRPTPPRHQFDLAAIDHEVGEYGETGTLFQVRATLAVAERVEALAASIEAVGTLLAARVEALGRNGDV
jgi:hypothetical protein